MSKITASSVHTFRKLIESHSISKKNAWYVLNLQIVSLSCDDVKEDGENEGTGTSEKINKDNKLQELSWTPERLQMSSGKK